MRHFSSFKAFSSKLFLVIKAFDFLKIHKIVKAFHNLCLSRSVKTSLCHATSTKATSKKLCVQKLVLFWFLIFVVYHRIQNQAHVHFFFVFFLFVIVFKAFFFFSSLTLKILTVSIRIISNWSGKIECFLESNQKSKRLIINFSWKWK